MDDKIDAGSIVIGGFGLPGIKDPFLGIAMKRVVVYSGQ